MTWSNEIFFCLLLDCMNLEKTFVIQFINALRLLTTQFWSMGLLVVSSRGHATSDKETCYHWLSSQFLQTCYPEY